MRTICRRRLVQVRLPDGERARVIEAARREERTISELVRDAIRTTPAAPSAPVEHRVHS